MNFFIILENLCIIKSIIFTKKTVKPDHPTLRWSSDDPVIYLNMSTLHDTMRLTGPTHQLATPTAGLQHQPLFSSIFTPLTLFLLSSLHLGGDSKVPHHSTPQTSPESSLKTRWSWTPASCTTPTSSSSSLDPRKSFPKLLLSPSIALPRAKAKNKTSFFHVILHQSATLVGVMHVVGEVSFLPDLTPLL